MPLLAVLDGFPIRGLFDESAAAAQEEAVLGEELDEGIRNQVGLIEAMT